MATGLFTLKQVNQALRQGAWTGTQKTSAVDYLVVAGGGAGGDNADPSNGNGGGGAGGLLQGNVGVATGSAITVTIGAGSDRFGTAGSDSVFGSITSKGGGTGARFNANGSYSGGSGGGGSSGASYLLESQGTGGQGNAGGSGLKNNSGGGGGGAGTVGLNAVTNLGGNGGAGIASSISGTVTAYAGGGGGGALSTGTVGAGGAGGGGAGNGTNASANTGGGGGGSSNNSVAGTGGSGIVILSYPDTYAAPTSTTGSPTVSTSGSGSVYFNGSSALTYPTNSAFAFGTGDFTVEFWVYATSLPTYAWMFDFYTPSGYVGLPCSIEYYAPTSKIRYSSNSGDRIIGTTTISINTWYHVAICRSGTTTTMYVNGSSNGSYSDTYNYVLPTNSQPVIGSRGNYGYPLYGYMSNMRIVKGTALYTSNFTPSTIPLTVVSGTSLLLNTVSGAYPTDSSGNAFTATATGTPAWNALSPFTVTGYKNRVYTWTSSGSITF